MTEPTELAPAPGLEQLWTTHRAGLVRVAALLLDDAALAEDVVQDSFIRCWAAWRRVDDADAALAYLRKTVTNTARSALRRRRVARRHDVIHLPDAPASDVVVADRLDRDRVVQALRALPRRQREAVVLRWYADLTEADAARAMGVSVGSVKSYTSRGMAALAVALEDLR
jgi:RNA polymerase sigma-70 factor (sigma-E family)